MTAFWQGVINPAEFENQILVQDKVFVLMISQFVAVVRGSFVCDSQFHRSGLANGLRGPKSIQLVKVAQHIGNKRSL